VPNLREQSEGLLEGNRKAAKWDEGALAAQIRGLEQLLRRQLDAQTEFLRPEPRIRSPAPRKSRGIHRKCLPIEESDDAPGPARISGRIPGLRKSRQVYEEEQNEEAPSPKAQRESADRRHRRLAEREADEVLREIEAEPPREKKLEKRDRNHVEELVDLTNKLRDDYRRLGHYFNDETGGDLSIAQLARMNDSLLSAEHRLSSTFD
jgi:hypothetical protein